MTMQRLLDTWGDIGFYSVDIHDGHNGAAEVDAISTQLKAQGALPEALRVTGVACTPRDYGIWDTWVTDSAVPWKYNAVYYRIAIGE